MRTTIDLPDSLLRRVKRCLVERKLTFRALVISALEETLREETGEHFKLRDASTGETGGKVISSEKISQAIDAQRERSFDP